MQAKTSGASDSTLADLGKHMTHRREQQDSYYDARKREEVAAKSYQSIQKNMNAALHTEKEASAFIPVGEHQSVHSSYWSPSHSPSHIDEEQHVSILHTPKCVTCQSVSWYQSSEMIKVVA